MEGEIAKQKYYQDHEISRAQKTDW